MAQAVSSDQNMINILKTWYTDEKLENLLFRNSPVARKIKKIRIGGKTYNFSMFYGRGGAVSGDYSVAIANNTATGSAQNAEMAVPPGKIFSVFTFNQLEMLASSTGKGAYIQAAVDKMFAATESMRKTFAACLYGTGYGDIGIIYGIYASATSVADAVTQVTAAPTGKTAAAQVNVAMTLATDAAIKIDVGSVLNIQATYTDSIPGAVGLLSSDMSAVAGGVSSLAEFTVTVIGSPFTTGGVTYVPVGGTLGTTPAATWTNMAVTAGAQCVACLKGSRTAATSGPNMPTGLRAWIPGYGKRTSANWATYIASSFFGQARNVAVDRLAGAYTKKSTQPNTKYYETLLDGIKLVRRQGGVPDMIVVNDNDYGALLAELNAATTMFQSVNVAPGGKVNRQFGAADLGFQFSTNWLQYVYDDPYCPVGAAWILDSSVVNFVGLSNAASIIDSEGVTDNNPGVANVTDASAPDMNFKFLIDDYLNVVPGTVTADGPAALATLSLYGNFVVRNPSNCCYCDFAN